MTTVSQRDGLTLGQALVFWVSGRDQLLPRELVYPPDKSKEEIDKANTKDFRQSEDSAEYAALDYLKYPMAVTVETVDDKGPSTGKLQAGDAIDTVNNKPVANLDEFQEILKGTKPGDHVVIDYRRKNAPAGTADITLGKQPGTRQGFLGVGVLDAPWAPFTIDFNLANIGGPSAGSDVQPGRGRQADHRRPQRVEVRGGHRHHHRRRQGRLDRRHHPQDGRGQEAGATCLPGACRELRRGARPPTQDGIELFKVDTLGPAIDALRRFPLVANLPVAERSRPGGCVELWHWTTSAMNVRDGVDEWVCGPRRECRS